MSSRRAKRPRTSGASLDMSNYLNWPVSKLREEIHKKGIKTSPTFSISVLRKLYTENVGNRTASEAIAANVLTLSAASSSNTTGDVMGQCNQSESAVLSTNGSITSQEPPSTNFIGVAQGNDSDYFSLRSAPTNADFALRLPTIPASGSTSAQESSAANMAAPMLQSLTQTVSSLQTVMSGLLQVATGNISAQNNETNTGSLQRYYNSLSTATSSLNGENERRHLTLEAQHQRQRFGTSPEELPQMDLVAESLRKRVIEGKDVNLASLLIPYYEADSGKEKVDNRLKRSLSITEFITAFGRYKRIMCQAFPQRREELDRYEMIIVDLYNLFGNRFYEYHKLFSLQSSNALQMHGIKVDWSVRDRNLIQLISAGAQNNTCRVCGEVSHDTKFCPQNCVEENTSSRNNDSVHRPNVNSSVDRHGRKRVSVNGVEVCNNFNTHRGCSRQACPFLHICLTCRSKNHSSVACKPNTSSESTSTTKNSAGNSTNKRNK